MKKKIVKTCTVLLILLLLCAVFVSGCAQSSHDWFVNTIKKYYYEEVPDEAFEGDDFKQIVAQYLDRYSAYYTKEEYEEVIKSNAGSKSGIGISYSFVEGRGIYIASVVGNSPADASGLCAGEWIESGFVGEQEVVFSSSQDFVNLINSVGEGENIKLINTEGEAFTVAKSEYTATYAYMASNDNAWVYDDRITGETVATKKISYLPEDTAYIRLSQFYGDAAGEFDGLIKRFNSEGFSSLILDLRSNGGGYVAVMQQMAYAFSGSTKTLAMLSKDKKGREVRFNCVKVNSSAAVIRPDVKVYVLANSSSASASEALIGAMISYGVLEYRNIFLSDYSQGYMDYLSKSGQELKTAQTYGKGIMQSTFINNSTKEALKLTTDKIYWPDESTCIHGRGLTVADGCTPVFAEWEHTKSDEELQRAVEIIKTR